MANSASVMSWGVRAMRGSQSDCLQSKTIRLRCQAESMENALTAAAQGQQGQCRRQEQRGGLGHDRIWKCAGKIAGEFKDLVDLPVIRVVGGDQQLVVRAEGHAHGKV